MHCMLCQTIWATKTDYIIVTKLLSIKQQNNELVDEYHARICEMCHALKSWLEDKVVVLWFHSGLQT